MDELRPSPDADQAWTPLLTDTAAPGFTPAHIFSGYAKYAALIVSTRKRETYRFNQLRETYRFN